MIRPVQNGWVLTLFKAPIYIAGSTEHIKVEEFSFVFTDKKDLEHQVKEFIENPNNVLGRVPGFTSSSS